ncbi:MAG: alpha-2-macroglobulin family protein, partial [Flammeovirgaceae bacterium]
GLESKVGFRVLNEFGKPADVSGVLLDHKGNELTTFSSFHQGMGSFSFLPQKNKNYHIKITQPKGIAKTYELPEALPQGYQLSKLTADKDHTTFLIQATVDEELSLMGQVRGKAYYSNSFRVRANQSYELKVDTKSFPMGVAQFTLFDSKGIERAERLTFVNKQKQLKIDIQTDKEKYQPREKVTMTITVRDERGIPIPAQLSIAVTDDNIVSFADDKQGHILSKLLLEPDLTSEVYEPNFYFDDHEEKAAEALDYLMLTQGWRRFTWKEILSNQAPVFAHAAERAIIQGTVYTSNGKVCDGATVHVNSTGQEVKTDESGKFYIKGHALYNQEIITVKKGEQQGSISIQDYNQNLTVHLSNNTYWYEEDMAFGDAMDGAGADRLKIRQAVKPLALGNAANKEMAFGAEKAPVDPLIEQPIIVKNEEIMEGNEVVKGELKANKDLKPMNEKLAVAEEVADIEFVDADVFDNRLMVEEKKLPAKVTYYRAREFAAPIYTAHEKPEIRTDFRSTVYWKGNVEVDRRGKAVIEFYNSDAITSFRATAEGVGADGLVGRKEQTYFTQLPFSMDAKVPVEVTMGDVVYIPLSLTNNTPKHIAGKLTVIAPTGWVRHERIPPTVSLAAESAETLYLPFKIENLPSEGNFKIKFDDGTNTDAFIQEVKIVSKGFPVSIAISGDQLEGKHQFEVSHAVKGTLRANLTAYPTALSDMMAGIESILREPYGCFEQTSSSTYPNIMVMQYLEEYDFEDQTVLARAKQLVDKGYKRLISFETPEKGYEWFGGAPGHEALTAYGLMEFADMSKVYHQVDQGMVDRTANWLLARKDNQGGFARNPRALDSFGRADDKITNAYIVYALSEAGYVDEIKKEIDAAVAIAKKDNDPYQMALTINALFNVNDKRATSLLAVLNQKQKQDGRFDGLSHSVTRSTGKALTIETTALSVLANLKAADKSTQVIHAATKYIMQNRSAYGGYGNTQSTIMALKALTEFASYAKRTAESGDIEVFVDGKKVSTKHFEKGQQGAIIIDGLETYLKEGKHQVEVKFKNTKKALPYTLAINYSTHLPQSSKACAVSLATKLNTPKAKMGETVRLSTTLKNLQEEGQPMTIAIIGIPGGLSPQPWQLKELQEKGIVDYYEVIGSNVVLYYRQLLPNEIKTIHLDLKADITGDYEAAASSAYLYYTNEFKSWVAGEKVSISQ